MSFASLEAPPRAEDAALVPVTMSVHAPAGDARRVVKLSLVIDENPVPLAGEFTLGAKSDVAKIATRVRVNAYTNMRLIAELSDGSLHMAKVYVKAAGGCSAPATKNLDEPSRTRQDEAARDRRRRRRTRRFRRHAAPSQQFRPADGPGHAALYAGALCRSSRDLPGRRIWSSLSRAGYPSPRTRISASTSRATTPSRLRVEASDIDNTHFKANWTLDRGGS